jgi:hypothetical protein
MNRKIRTVFTVVGFELEYLQVVRSSVDENEIIRIPLHKFTKEFLDKVTYGLENWEDGVYFIARIELVPGFEKVYMITDVEEDIKPVPAWEEILEGNFK